MFGVLAEDGAVAPILEVALLLPGFSLVGRGDDAALDEPVERAVAPLRQRFRCVGRARLESLAAVGGAQQARVWQRLRLCLGDNRRFGIEDPCRAITLGDLPEALDA